MARVAFIGLGVMGYPMAGHQARAGHAVTVFNRTRSTAERWVEEHGGAAAASPAAACEDAEFVFTCVGRDEDVRAVTLERDGAFAGMRGEAILVDHTTTSAELARELDSSARERGLAFVDAPVSGGQAGAENGKLAIMTGGRKEHYDRVLPLLECYGARIDLMGPAGAGQLTKMVNQICIAGLVQALSEGLNFAQRSGLDGEQVAQLIGAGAAQSWQLDNRHATMLADEFEFGFAVDWMRKDLGYAMDEAERNGAELPVAELVDRFYAEIQAMGGGRWDTSSLIRRLRDRGASRPISRVLSRAIIHLGPPSPAASSSLPGSACGHTHCFPIQPCSGRGLPCHGRCRPRGALLPHHFTLTRHRPEGRRAVSFLWHFP